MPIFSGNPIYAEKNKKDRLNACLYCNNLIAS